MLNKGQKEKLVFHLREIANILAKDADSDNKPQAKSGSAQQQQQQSETNTITVKRGRKPGTVSDDIRCQGESSLGARCKNRATNGSFCGKHL